jgi:hypothetical protein
MVGQPLDAAVSSLQLPTQASTAGQMTTEEIGFSGLQQAAEQRDAPDEALGLRMAQNGPGVVNVRFAGDRDCYPDPSLNRE